MFSLLWVAICYRVSQLTLHLILKDVMGKNVMISLKWNKWGFSPPLSIYRLNWARRTSWGWWDEWDKTALQTQDSIFDSWRSEVEHVTSRSRRFPTILNHYEWTGKNHCVSLKLESQRRVRTRDSEFSKQAALTTAPVILIHHNNIAIMIATQ